MTPTLTKHAQARAKQRSFTGRDIDWIRKLGTEIPDNTNEVYLVRKKDIAPALADLKREMQRLQKLAGCAAVLSGNCVLTVYRTNQKTEKQLLRRQK